MTVFCFTLAILAQLPAPESASSVGWLLLTIAALALGAERIFVLVDRFKGNKPTASDLQTFPTRSDLDSVDRRLTGEIVVLHKRQEALEKTVSNELQSINRSLGRIEGQLGTAPKNK